MSNWERAMWVFVGGLIVAGIHDFFPRSFNWDSFEFWVNRYQTGLGTLIAGAALFGLLNQLRITKDLHDKQVNLTLRPEMLALSELQAYLALLPRKNIGTLCKNHIQQSAIWGASDLITPLTNKLLSDLDRNVRDHIYTKADRVNKTVLQINASINNRTIADDQREMLASIYHGVLIREADGLIEAIRGTVNEMNNYSSETHIR